MMALWLTGLLTAQGADWTAFSADPARPATTSSTLVVTETTERPPLFDARATLSWTHHPLVLYPPGGAPVPWIGNTATAHLSVAGGWGPLRVAISEPVGAAWGGEALDGPVAAAGDPALSARLAWRGDAAGAGLSGDLTLPLGADRVWLGEAGGTVGLGLLADGRLGAALGALNLGVRAQPERLLDDGDDAATLKRTLWARAGVSVDVKKNLALSLEGLGARDLSGQAGEQGSPLELLVGATRLRADGAALRVSAGVGVLPGVGAPAARLMVGFGQRPAQTRERPPEIIEVPAAVSEGPSEAPEALGG